MSTPTSRLRRAFRYPDDNGDSPDKLDEEHQEKLISDLQTKDAAKNDLYRKAFLAIPLLAALFFLITLITSTTARQRLIALLSVSSLAATAWILHYQPIEAPDKKGKRPVYQVEAGKGPVEKYLVYLNAGLAGLLVVAAMLSWRRGLGEDAWRQALPGIIFGLTMAARQLLAPLDLEELQRARYGLKGA
ncbi:hypothetical protein CLAFUW4_13533 [Fulvia fulva]|uniref:Uncharacterized protein n=1 Tax=Passalora fulva TaxID=5499 RepID=A0A9Q8UVZ1_PASFU|nr:uncharacterized protein CLAFUR5_13384 [Fulvia fulva]KAK4610085.1 hypothetical protein CLAFUR4_13535 [Fulvia fulva]KAK4611438.1 hypothetical protein CLAFUR0_13544 [Fulvia fulva]UJO24357.1 hypothetical protein CLAFUR5_13384 [Fulvia fulva]WPV21860.1 hypothetical protein CLAFUW4_13533 [Fulvia fulva]WPV36898.1 hypothetical protein CLAFUW7_13540 [Fulvia fulva]